MWIEVCILRGKNLGLHSYTSQQKIWKLIFKNCKQLLQKISWRSTKNQTIDSKLNTFANCYNEFSLQSYLDLNLSKSIVKNLTKLRISAHTLLIEKGRYFRPKVCRNLKLCSLCNKIEDEEHFLLFCKKTWYLKI